MPRANTHGTTSRGISLGSPDASAEADEFLLIRLVIAEDESPWAESCRVALGATPTDPELNLTGKILNDGAQLALRRLWRRSQLRVG